MNYFIANGNMYERNELTAAFTVKKIFSDNGGEALETSSWVPYLRNEPLNDARLQELLNGEKPKHSLFTTESLAYFPAPEGLEAAQVVVYRIDQPLADFIKSQGSDIVIGFFVFAVISAALALLLSSIKQKKHMR